MTDLDPYWMHDGPAGCQEAEAKLARIAALFDDQAAHLGTVKGERVYGETDLRAILEDPQ